MAISLKKGAKVSLTKAEPGLDAIHIGLGWDLRPGLAFDVDASVFLLGGGRKVRRDEDFVFYNNKKSPCGAVEHRGDNRSGVGDGDDEVILVDLRRVPDDVDALVVAVTIHDGDARRQTFSQIDNAFIRVVNQRTKAEVARFDLGRQAPADGAMVFGEVTRNAGEWHFRAVGDGLAGDLGTLAELFGVDVRG